MSSITYQVELFSSLLTTDGRDLFEKHYEEIALHKDSIPLDPDYDKYDALESAGCLLTITARDDGNLIGYSIFLVDNHLHYASTYAANNDVIFIDKQYRKGRVGLGLIQYSEKALREIGVDRIHWHVKVLHDFGHILERLGYAREEVIWGKCVKDNK